MNNHFIYGFEKEAADFKGVFSAFKNKVTNPFKSKPAAPRMTLDNPKPPAPNPPPGSTGGHATTPPAQEPGPFEKLRQKANSPGNKRLGAIAAPIVGTAALAYGGYKGIDALIGSDAPTKNEW